MDNLTGITLFEPTDLKLNINNQQEEDEEAIEDQKRRNEVVGLILCYKGLKITFNN